MSYHAFAAGAAAYGISVAVRAAVTYKVPCDTCIAYLRRYVIEGYVV